MGGLGKGMGIRKSISGRVSNSLKRRIIYLVRFNTTLGAGWLERRKASLLLSQFCAPQGSHCQGCWHSKGLPEVTVSFSCPLAAGGMQGHRGTWMGVQWA